MGFQPQVAQERSYERQRIGDHDGEPVRDAPPQDHQDEDDALQGIAIPLFLLADQIAIPHTTHKAGELSLL